MPSRARTASGSPNVGLFVAFNLPVYRDKYRAGVCEAKERAIADVKLYEAERDEANSEIQDFLTQARVQKNVLDLLRDSILPAHPGHAGTGQDRLPGQQRRYRDGAVGPAGSAPGGDPGSRRSRRSWPRRWRRSSGPSAARSTSRRSSTTARSLRYHFLRLPNEGHPRPVEDGTEPADRMLTSRFRRLASGGSSVAGMGSRCVAASPPCPPLPASAACRRRAPSRP